MSHLYDTDVMEALWTRTPHWTCPHCVTVNHPVREKCRACGYDSNAGEFPYYNPLPPYEGREEPPSWSGAPHPTCHPIRRRPNHE